MPLITPNRVASFSANKNSIAQTGVPSATVTKVTFTNEEFDLGGFYDAANSKWTPPAGVVSLVSSIRLSGANLVDGAVVSIVIRKNGATVRSRRAIITGTPIEFSIYTAGLDVANGADFYETFIYAEGAGDKSVDGLNSATFFQGSILN